MTVTTEPVVMSVEGLRMLGFVHRPEQCGKHGVMIIVGGPQYRVGSHRQFVLLARYLAACGIPVFRFDYRGMGDSEGDDRIFEDIHEDIRTALDSFFDAVPDMQDVVLWGLCDAASAAMMYADDDPRVAGLVLLNPWVRADDSIARTYLRHYYLTKVLDGEFWKKLLSGKLDISAAGAGLVQTLRQAVARTSESDDSSSAAVTQTEAPRRAPFIDRMRIGLDQFKGQALFILSGDDLTAAEFSTLVDGSRAWSSILQRPGIASVEVREANHTFSRRAWRDEVAERTRSWVEAL